jgi:predicted small metal-binding protein
MRLVSLIGELRVSEETHMFEFVCEKLIPGCTHRETGDTPERVREKALEHLQEHHGAEYLDRDLGSRIDLALFPFEER